MYMQSIVAATALFQTAIAASGSFSVLSFNVAGLPAFLQSNGVPGDKTTNTKTIGSKFAQGGYDIIHVQEDFNYHSALYSTDNHPQRTSTSGGVPFGSGLNTLANFAWTSLKRTTWSDCFIGEGDCLTPKGFTYMRIQIPNGPAVDLYNLHCDAGTASGDNSARQKNIQQVANAIDANSQGMPVLVFGDTNTRYTRAEDNIALLGTQNDLKDAWVQIRRGGVQPTPGSAVDACPNPAAEDATCETVDKVLYRGSSTVTLTATSFAYVGDRFLQADGNVTSDHNPLLVNFSWSN